MPRLHSIRHRDPTTNEYLGEDIFLGEVSTEGRQREIRVRHRDDAAGIVMLVTYPSPLVTEDLPLVITRMDIEMATTLRDALTRLIEAQLARKTP